VVGLDPGTANNAFGVFFGRAVGQSFLAQDTVISKLTVWRPPNNLSVVGAHLFITAVDTTVSPPRPDTGQILLDGPTVTVFDSNPPGQLIEMEFVLNPPLILPRPGRYAWFLQADACNQGDVWEIVADDRNLYSDGIAWITGRANLGCYLAPVEGGDDNLDLISHIEFCTATTPTIPASWGALKVIYR
jgi:hypothetical protein